jgi:hypothetical protein
MENGRRIDIKAKEGEPLGLKLRQVGAAESSGSGVEALCRATD